MFTVIDPHIHFFNLQQGEYQWLTGDNPPNWSNLNLIRQNHGPKHLSTKAFQVESVVHIEAGFNNQDPYKELEWLENTVPPLNYVAIGYLDITLTPSVFSRKLKRLQNSASLRGIRDITEGQDSQRLLHPNVFANLATLSEQQLIFEAQFELHLSHAAMQIANYCTQLPALQLHINHAGLLEQHAHWEHSLQILSNLPNIAIKFSGFEHVHRPLSQQACLSLLCHYFGDERVMMASNFPICLMKKSYQKLWLDYKVLVESDTLWHKLSYQNAKRLYKL